MNLTPFIKIDQKRIINLNVLNVKTIKKLFEGKERNLEENLDEYLFDFELGNIFLAMIPKRVNYKRKNRKLNLIKI